MPDHVLFLHVIILGLFCIPGFNCTGIRTPNPNPPDRLIRIRIGSRFGLYTILPLPILCGIYCNNGVSMGNIILRNTVGDDGVGWGA